MISAVIPAFNPDYSHLERTLASALASGVDEVVIVDDGSVTPVLTDSEMGDDFGWADPRVQVVRLASNRGPAVAMNVGCESAKGEYIARLDVGDVWYPNEKRAQFAASLDKPATFARSFDEHRRAEYPIHEQWRGRLWRDNVFQASSWVIRRDVWAALRLDEELRYSDDWDFAIRIEHAYGWHFHSECTGTATCWPGGHTDVVISAAVKRRQADRKKVIRKTRDLYRTRRVA